MKKFKRSRDNYDTEKFTKRKKSGWVKPGRLNDRNRLKRFENMSTKDLDSDDYIDEEEIYR